MSLPKDFIDINLAFSRTPGEPQPLRAGPHARAIERPRRTLLKEPDTYIYVCGLKAMEEGVLLALRDVAAEAGLAWDSLAASLKREGRLHLETY